MLPFANMPWLPSHQIFSMQACSAERVGGANITWDILLLISTGENMAVAYLHWEIGVWPRDGDSTRQMQLFLIQRKKYVGHVVSFELIAF